ncbi:hypothetical protein ASJ81_13730 [Methanosarcina spelaei]|uniref:Uncharacterized protein n=1 Tax=Methanosarcina spelaei TaxID=1036679 RepID=A0A2A2HZ16_9EURY|nr:hypothetical protein [Methanosarcina spelaei]PAV14445.1 hypothetical protein ASJ81_13730 [Methanosarcina spelaei]
MTKLMKIVGYILAAIGLAYVVKHIMHCKERCCFSGWHKTKTEDEKSTDSTVSHKIKVEDETSTGSTVPHETEAEDEKRTGSRYGSNPINY